MPKGREELHIRVAFWERIKKSRTTKHRVPASLSQFTCVGKWLIFARALIKENLSPTILNVCLCFHCFSGEKEDTKPRPVFL